MSARGAENELHQLGGGLLILNGNVDPCLLQHGERISDQAGAIVRIGRLLEDSAPGFHKYWIVLPNRYPACAASQQLRLPVAINLCALDGRVILRMVPARLVAPFRRTL